VFVQVPVLPQVARREQLCDEVDAVVLLILPALKALDDVGVLQVKALQAAHAQQCGPKQQQQQQ
jgi:hypothetical protein